MAASTKGMKSPVSSRVQLLAGAETAGRWHDVPGSAVAAGVGVAVAAATGAGAGGVSVLSAGLSPPPHVTSVNPRAATDPKPTQRERTNIRYLPRWSECERVR